jgi:hypothetical protein
VPGARLQLLCEELGVDAERVGMLDMTVAARNPGRIIAEVWRATTDTHPGQRLRKGRDTTIRCPYDVAGLDPNVLADAANTHPVLVQSGDTSGLCTERVIANYNRSLPELDDAKAFTFDASRLRQARRSAAEHARRAVLDAARVEDVVDRSVAHSWPGHGPLRRRLPDGKRSCRSRPTVSVSTDTSRLAGRGR